MTSSLFKRSLVWLYIMAVLFSVPVFEARATSTGPVTGFPMPRFVSLQASEANVRTGPGYTYPIQFQYLRAQQPLEIIDEYDHWRKVRDWQGDEGWVHRRLLTGSRYLRVMREGEILRSRDDLTAPIKATLGEGLILQLLKCRSNWCRVSHSGYTGWLPKDAVYGTYPREEVQ